MTVKTDGYAKSRARTRLSPSTQRIDCGLMAVKIDGYAEGRSGPKKILSVQWPPMPRVSSKKKSYYVADELCSEGYEDGRQCRGLY